MIINRDFYLNKLISARQNNMVKVITGIRRCGKSFLLFNLFKEYLSQNGKENLVSSGILKAPENHIPWSSLHENAPAN